MAVKAAVIRMADPLAWLDALTPLQVLLELSVVTGCVLLAWLLVWLVRRVTLGYELRILLGRRLMDGVLFPLLLMGMSFAARTVLAHQGEAVLLDIWVPVCVSLACIRLGVKVLQVTLPHAEWVRPIERTLSWLAWGGAVLWITGLLPLLLDELDQIHWKVGNAVLSVRTLLEGGVTALGVLILTLWLSSAIESRLLSGVSGSELSLRKAMSNAVTALLMFIGVLMALSSAGIDLTALSVMGGAVGVGIGLGLQKLAANYVSGFVILAERSMRIGDMVRVDGFEGRITDIKARYTVIRALSGRESIVPNEMLITQRVENLSLADPKVAQTTQVTVAYNSPVDEVVHLLEQACTAQPRVLAEPAPAACLLSFGADGLEFTVTYWIADPENGPAKLKSDINRAILHALRAQQIEIPFPQRVVHSAAPT
jgi:small-conductance mechanosensitive channel